MFPLLPAAQPSPRLLLRLKNILQRFEELNLEEKQGKGGNQMSGCNMDQ